MWKVVVWWQMPGEEWRKKEKSFKAQNHWMRKYLEAEKEAAKYFAEVHSCKCQTWVYYGRVS